MGKDKTLKKAKSSSTIPVKDSIKTKLITVMLGVAAIPLAISLIISYNTSTSTAKADSLEILAANANHIGALFAGTIDEHFAALETLATSPSTITYLNTHDTDEQDIPDSAMMTQLNAIN